MKCSISNIIISDVSCQNDFCMSASDNIMITKRVRKHNDKKISSQNFKREKERKESEERC